MRKTNRRMCRHRWFPNRFQENWCLSNSTLLRFSYECQALKIWRRSSPRPFLRGNFYSAPSVDKNLDSIYSALDTTYTFQKNAHCWWVPRRKVEPRLTTTSLCPKKNSKIQVPITWGELKETSQVASSPFSMKGVTLTKHCKKNTNAESSEAFTFKLTCSEQKLLVELKPTSRTQY